MHSCCEKPRLISVINLCAFSTFVDDSDRSQTMPCISTYVWRLEQGTHASGSQITRRTWLVCCVLCMCTTSHNEPSAHRVPKQEVHVRNPLKKRASHKSEIKLKLRFIISCLVAVTTIWPSKFIPNPHIPSKTSNRYQY